MNASSKLAWHGGKCRVPMWAGGCPSGFCDEEAFGPQYPREYLAHRDARYMFDQPAYCHGPCCPAHGGPRDGDPIIFQDGYTEQGRQMWCAVMPDFQNLQESPAGFSGNPIKAVEELRRAVGDSPHSPLQDDADAPVPDNAGATAPRSAFDRDGEVSRG